MADLLSHKQKKSLPSPILSFCGTSRACYVLVASTVSTEKHTLQDDNIQLGLETAPRPSHRCKLPPASTEPAIFLSDVSDIEYQFYLQVVKP